MNVMYILDWGSRCIELFPRKANYNDRFVKVDRQILKSALQFHGFKTTDPTTDRFTREEVAIRDNFDRFLSYFERFEHFVEAGIITTEELRPYLQYWINTISEEIEDHVKNFIFHFIEKYHYKGTQKLFKAFDKDIFPKTNIETTRNLTMLLPT